MRRPGKLRDKEERIMYKNIEKQTALELREIAAISTAAAIFFNCFISKIS